MRTNSTLLIIATLTLGYKARSLIKSHTALQHTKTVSIISDNNFSNGLYLIFPNSATPFPIDTLYPFGKTNVSPSWNIMQWATRFDLKGIRPLIKNDTVIYQNEGKKLSFLKTDQTTLVGLEVAGSKEYTAPRKDKESWVHLLLEQKFKNKVVIKSIKKLVYTIDARLLYAENKMGVSFDKRLHTAQISLYLSVENVNKQSAGYGDYFWFGLPLYDYRYRDFLQYAAQDLGKADATKKFIFTVAGKELFNGSLQDKQWISINKDVYPQMIAGFGIAKERGFLCNTTLSDLAIVNANLGWEVTGTFDCGIQFKNLILTAVLNK